VVFRSQRRRSFGYTEAIMSSLILGTAVLGGLKMTSSYIVGATAGAEMAAARELAAELMAEIMSKSFEDAVAASGSFGREAGETTRADFDDVDDYDKWKEKPIAAANGAALPTSVSHYLESGVVVSNVDALTLATKVADGSSDAKRIAVRIERNGKIRARLVAYRTKNDAWE
jgi:hypothetical protein